MIEGDEAFQISLMGRPEAHDVTLGDNDQPQVVVERVSGSGPVAEGDLVRLVARLVGGSVATEDLTVNLATGSISTISAEDIDVPFPSSVTIAMGSSREEFDVNVRNDGLAEFNEMVNIYVENVVTMAGEFAISDTGYSFEITSADKITAEIEVEDTDEDAGQARVTITLSQPLPENVSSGALMLNLVNSERTSDLSMLPADVTDRLKRSSATQNPAEVSTVVMVDLTDDDRWEGNELVRLLLQVVTPELATLMSSVNASFDIIDNEQGTISVSSSSTANEGAMVLLKFSLPPGVKADSPIMVNYEISDPRGLVVSASGLGTGFAKGFALPVRGFAQAPSTMVVTIPVGENSVELPIQLAQDTTPEETEQLSVRIESVSTMGAPVRTDQGQVDIMVLDDEPSTYEIIGSGEVNEDDGTYPVRLRRLGRINTGGEMVPYVIRGRGADEGDFAGELSGMFEFSGMNPLSEEIVLMLNNDRSEEAPKTFRIEVGQLDAMGMLVSAPLVDRTGSPVSGFSVILLDFDVAAFSGLPATGGPVLPVWLLLTLALTGVVLLGGVVGIRRFTTASPRD